MKAKIIRLACGLALLGATVTASAQFTTNTLSFYNAQWDDGGSLDGYITVQYANNSSSVSVLSFDITTGDSSDGFLGYNYIYNVLGQADTATTYGAYFVPPSQVNGNRVIQSVLTSPDQSTYFLTLSWQVSSTPEQLYMGSGAPNTESLYSQDYFGFSGNRSISPNGGSAGSPTPAPEPSTLALAGLGGVSALAMLRRRK